MILSAVLLMLCPAALVSDAPSIVRRFLYPELERHRSDVIATNTDLYLLVRPGGAPRTVTWTQTWAPGDPGDFYMRATVDYDRHGECIRYSIGGPGEVPTVIVYERDDDGRVIRTHQTTEMGDLTYEWDYDDQGRPTECRSCVDGACREYLKYTYSDGLLRSSSFVSEDGEEHGTTHFTYDDDDQLVQSERAGVRWTVEWEAGLPVRRRAFEGAEQTADRRWRYGVEGRLLYDESIAPYPPVRGGTTTHRQLYDRDGRLILKQFSLGTGAGVFEEEIGLVPPVSSGDAWTEFYGGEDLLLGRMSSKDGTATEFRVQHVFDQHGNWIVRLEPGLEEDKRTTRTIEYWD